MPPRRARWRPSLRPSVSRRRRLPPRRRPAPLRTPPLMTVWPAPPWQAPLTTRTKVWPTLPRSRSRSPPPGPCQSGAARRSARCSAAAGAAGLSWRSSPFFARGPTRGTLRRPRTRAPRAALVSPARLPAPSATGPEASSFAPSWCCRRPPTTPQPRPWRRQPPAPPPLPAAQQQQLRRRPPLPRLPCRPAWSRFSPSSTSSTHWPAPTP
mmetsp:Transcript_14674/g.55278  ORF Transcript_14674/g.55278 Transcript_14674/m.55278 type:complete len:210 (+) Transcript_14674:1052-1681(+)